jgi:uracil-DNA glycosylase
MPRQKRDLIEYLFKARKNVAPDQYGKVTPAKKMLRSTAFFPGGSGLWDTPPNDKLPGCLQAFHSFFVNPNIPPTMPKKKIMILGNDFGLKDGYKKVRDNPYENLNSSSTWRNLLELLHCARIKPKNCFFTNAYIGLRITGKGTGQSPGAADPEFVERCESFFLDKQIMVQKPRLILALGKHSIKFIAGLSPDLAEWKECETFPELDDSDLGPLVKKVRFNNSKPATVVALVHPAGRNMGNALRNRHYRGKQGEAAELKMLKRALKKSGLR